MNTKLCSKCRQIKTLNLFHVDKNKKDVKIQTVKRINGTVLKILSVSLLNMR